jgi:hypothetical protein
MKFYNTLLVLLLIILIIIYYESQPIENFGNFNSSCGEYPELLHKVMKERNMKEDKKDYDIYIPCSYNNCEEEVIEFEGKRGKKLFLIDGCDWIASKMALWELLKEYYQDDASKYMPTSFLLDNIQDLKDFPAHFEANKKNNPKQMYVLKNYAQRQEGIKLTRNLNEILNGIKEGWYLVQDYKYNPYIINNRKINFRYYMLVVCINGKIEAYIHSDGFLYYTPKYYDPDDMDFDKHITTGYIDRKVYDVNPLTLEDFRIHLDKKGSNLRNKWNNSVETLMNKVMTAISKKICKNTKLDNNVRFQLFGCDVAPDSDLGCTLMEINKGPDLDAKDERDKQVKIQVQKDIFKIIDPNDDESITSTRFVRIY